MKQRTITTATLAASVFAYGTAVTVVQGQTSDPALNALVKKGILTEKEAKDALAVAEAEAKAKPSGNMQWAWKNGMGFQSADGMFKGKLGGRVQLDIASFSVDDEVETFDADGDGEAEIGDLGSGAEFRRVRLSLEGEFGTKLPVFFKTEYDFAPVEEVEFKDVLIGIDNIPVVGRVQVGHFKEPVGLDMLTSSRFLTFMERATPLETFAPERNIGVMAAGAQLDDMLTYALGLFTDSDSGKIVEDGLDSNWRATARVSASPIYDAATKGGTVLHLGISGSYAEPAGNEVRFRSRPEAHLAPRFVNTDFIAGADHTFLAGAEAAFVFGPFSAQAEYLRNWVSAPGDSLAFDGFYIFASWFITGEHRNYKRSSGTFDRISPNSNVTDGGLGAWEIAARYSQLDLNDQAVAGGRLNDITGAVNWYLNPNLRLQLNYVHAMLDRGTLDDGKAHIVQARIGVDF